MALELLKHNTQLFPRRPCKKNFILQSWAFVLSRVARGWPFPSPNPWIIFRVFCARDRRPLPFPYCQATNSLDNDASEATLKSLLSLETTILQRHRLAPLSRPCMTTTRTTVTPLTCWSKMICPLQTPFCLPLKTALIVSKLPGIILQATGKAIVWTHPLLGKSLIARSCVTIILGTRLNSFRLSKLHSPPRPPHQSPNRSIVVVSARPAMSTLAPSNAISRALIDLGSAGGNALSGAAGGSASPTSGRTTCVDTTWISTR